MAPSKANFKLMMREHGDYTARFNKFKTKYESRTNRILASPTQPLRSQLCLKEMMETQTEMEYQTFLNMPSVVSRSLKMMMNVRTCHARNHYGVPAVEVPISR